LPLKHFGHFFICNGKFYGRRLRQTGVLFILKKYHWLPKALISLICRVSVPRRLEMPNGDIHRQSQGSKMWWYQEALRQQTGFGGGKQPPVGSCYWDILWLAWLLLYCTCFIQVSHILGVRYADMLWQLPRIDFRLLAGPSVIGFTFL